MFRRRFLKSLIVGIGAIFVPRKKEGIGPVDTVPQTPPLPTLEWLQEREPRIRMVHVARYEGDMPCSDDRLRSKQGWWFTVFKERDPEPDYCHNIVEMHYVDGEWVVKYDTEKGALYPVDSYKPEWPDWLRKF